MGIIEMFKRTLKLWEMVYKAEVGIVLDEVELEPDFIVNSDKKITLVLKKKKKKR